VYSQKSLRIKFECLIKKQCGSSHGCVFWFQKMILDDSLQKCCGESWFFFRLFEDCSQGNVRCGPSMKGKKIHHKSHGGSTTGSHSEKYSSDDSQVVSSCRKNPPNVSNLLAIFLGKRRQNREDKTWTKTNSRS